MTQKVIDRNIDIERLRARIQNCTVGQQIHHFESVDSTMSIAQSQITSGEGSTANLAGTVIVAEEQTAGRGRRGRTWETPSGVALLTSTIAAAPYLPQNPATLPMIASLAAARAIEQAINAEQGSVMVKWPNDLLLPSGEDGSVEKAGGVLIETVFQKTMLTYAIIGIGINVNQTRNQLPSPLFGAPNPTSLRLYLHKAIDRTELLAHLCQKLNALLESPNATTQIFSAWRNRLHTLNRDVSVFEQVPSTVEDDTQISPVLQGKAVDVTADGALVVEDAHGVRHCISAGDVSVRHT